MKDGKIDVKIKLSALWVSVMFCYVFADILGNNKPEFLEGMIAGEVDGIQITQELLFGNAIRARVE